MIYLYIILIILYTVPALMVLWNGFVLLGCTYLFMRITGGMDKEDKIDLIKYILLTIFMAVFWLPVMIYYKVFRRGKDGN